MHQEDQIIRCRYNGSKTRCANILFGSPQKQEGGKKEENIIYLVLSRVVHQSDLEYYLNQFVQDLCQGSRGFSRCPSFKDAIAK